MAQQLRVPKTEMGLRDLLDEMYNATIVATQKGEAPAFKGILEVVQSEVVVVSAIHKLKANKGSMTAGVDGKTINDILTKDYNETVEMIKQKLRHYKPDEIRRVYIPKAGKKELRPLGIPTIIDRIIQQCLKIVIEPIFEAQFFKHSYGFRPMRDAKQAIERAVFVQNRTKCYWAVEGDIKGFFDNVNHTILIKQLRHMGLRDDRVLMIIKEMLKAGIMGEISRNEIGTPQGGIISPLLANIYLHKLDIWITREWEEKQLRNGGTSRIARLASLREHSSITKPEFYVRYADDWILFTTSKENAEKWKYRIEKYLKTNLKLELSKEKTLITNAKKKPIKFLGFKIKTLPMSKNGKYAGHAKPDNDKVKGKIQAVSEELRKLKYATDKEWLISDIHRVNSIIRGIINYYNTAPGVNREFRKYSDTLKYASYKALKKYGGKWIPANQCINTKMIYPERTEQIPAVEHNGEWVGIISLSFATWTKTPMKNQKETPYTKEGRELYINRNGKRPLLNRVQDLLDTEYFYTIMMGAKKPMYNFEFFMNRCYAFNRDKGKCALCNDQLMLGSMHTHHVDKRLPLQRINKVSNLLSLCDRCHKLIHTNSVEEEDIWFLKKTKRTKLYNLRSLNKGD